MITTKTITVYSPDALPTATAKRRAFDTLGQFETDDDWYHWIFEEFTRRLDTRGYQNPTLAFSGFGSQGDGASFTATLDLPRLYAALEVSLTTVPLDAVTATLTRIDHRYSHAHTVRVDVDAEDDGTPCSSARTAVLDTELTALEAALTDDVRTLSNELYRALEVEYFDRIDEANLLNVAEINDYWFDEGGHLVR